MTDDAMDEGAVLRAEELAAWTAHRPASDFTRRVLARLDDPPAIDEHERTPGTRRATIAAVAGIAVSLAAVLVLWLTAAPTVLRGGGRYDEGAIVNLAERGVVEVQSESELSWEAAPSGELRVTQTRGTLRYDVPAGPVVAVTTPFGVATFDDASATIAIGPATAAEEAVVEVHRGLVTLVLAHDRVTLAAGDRRVMQDDAPATPRVAAASQSSAPAAPVAVAPAPIATDAREPANRPRRIAKRDDTPELPVAAEVVEAPAPTPVVEPTIDAAPTVAPSVPVARPKAAPTAPAASDSGGVTVRTAAKTRYSVHCESNGVESFLLTEGSYSMDLVIPTESITCTVRLHSRGSLDVELRTPKGVRTGQLTRRSKKLVLHL